MWQVACWLIGLHTEHKYGIGFSLVDARGPLYRRVQAGHADLLRSCLPQVVQEGAKPKHTGAKPEDSKPRSTHAVLWLTAGRSPKTESANDFKDKV
jgi:hypothetical protein